jgi:hypothetical protein
MVSGSAPRRGWLTGKGCVPSRILGIHATIDAHPQDPGQAKLSKLGPRSGHSQGWARATRETPLRCCMDQFPVRVAPRTPAPVPCASAGGFVRVTVALSRALAGAISSPIQRGGVGGPGAACRYVELRRKKSFLRRSGYGNMQSSHATIQTQRGGRHADATR